MGRKPRSTDGGEVRRYGGRLYRDAKASAVYLGINRKTFYDRGLDKVIRGEPLGKGTRIYYSEEELDLYK